jgi:hypothetical protein
VSTSTPGDPSSSTEPPGGAHVELDIFSGRENPRWVLDPSTSNQLLDLHRRLQPGHPSADEPPGLGYRGFLYEIDGWRWRAWKGVVTGPDLVLSDPGLTIERILLAALPPEWTSLRPRIVTALGQAGP